MISVLCRTDDISSIWCLLCRWYTLRVWRERILYHTCGKQHNMFSAEKWYTVQGDNLACVWEEKSRRGEKDKKKRDILSDVPWCARRESNPHVLANTGTWSRRVYQFHHSRILFCFALLLSAGFILSPSATNVNTYFLFFRFYFSHSKSPSFFGRLLKHLDFSTADILL